MDVALAALKMGISASDTIFKYHVQPWLYRCKGFPCVWNSVFRANHLQNYCSLTSSSLVPSNKRKRQAKYTHTSRSHQFFHSPYQPGRIRRICGLPHQEHSAQILEFPRTGPQGFLRLRSTLYHMLNLLLQLCQWSGLLLWDTYHLIEQKAGKNGLLASVNVCLEDRCEVFLPRGYST